MTKNERAQLANIIYKKVAKIQNGKLDSFFKTNKLYLQTYNKIKKQYEAVENFLTLYPDVTIRFDKKRFIYITNQEGLNNYVKELAIDTFKKENPELLEEFKIPRISEIEDYLFIAQIRKQNDFNIDTLVDIWTTD